MLVMALLAALPLGIPADSPECKSPPSRASDSYWSYVEACGCSRLDPPSKASPDYDRFLKACSEWRERNPEIGVIEAPPSDAASPAPSPSPPAGPDDPR